MLEAALARPWTPPAASAQPPKRSPHPDNAPTRHSDPHTRDPATPRMRQVMAQLPATPAQVAERLGLSVENARGVLQQAQKRGLVRRGREMPASGRGGNPTYEWEVV